MASPPETVVDLKENELSDSSASESDTGGDSDDDYNPSESEGEVEEKRKRVEDDAPSKRKSFFDDVVVKKTLWAK